jgi:hypothetical protein
VLLTAIRVRLLLAGGIAYLMASKLPFIPSLVVLAIATILGVLIAIPTWGRTTAAAS